MKFRGPRSGCTKTIGPIGGSWRDNAGIGRGVDVARLTVASADQYERERRAGRVAEAAQQAKLDAEDLDLRGDIEKRTSPRRFEPQLLAKRLHGLSLNATT